MVKDPTTATNFLIDKDLKCEDDELSLELLSIIAMQLSQQLRSKKLALEAFKALSYLILNLHQKNVAAGITDNIAKAVSMATKRIRDELVAATDQLVIAAMESTEAGEQLVASCQETIDKYKGVIEVVTALIKDGGIQRNTGQNEGTRVDEEEVMNTYADRVKKKVPPTVVVARAETQKRKIRLITAMGMVGDC